jgi:serine/threonine-protein kinase
MLQMIRHGVADPVPVAVPAGLRTIVEKALEKDPVDRYQSARELVVDLRRVSRQRAEAGPGAAVTAGTPTPGRVSRRRAATLLVQGAVAGAAAAGGLAWTLRRPASPQNPSKTSIVLPEDQQFTRAHRRVIDISPDGGTIAYIANHQLFRRRLSDFAPEPVAGAQSEDPANPFFSPDGKWVGFWSGRDSTLKKIPIDGGPAVPLCASTLPFGATWEGNRVYFGQRGGLFSVTDGGSGKPDVVITLNPDEVAYSPQVLQGGELVLFSRGAGGGMRVVGYRRADARMKEIVPQASAARYVPETGHLLYAQRGDVMAVPFDLQNLETMGTPFSAILGVMLESFEGDNRGTGQAGNYAVSRGGTLAFVPSSSRQTDSRTRVIAVVDRDGANTRVLDLPPALYQYPRISPDGTLLAVQKDNNIWIRDLNRPNSALRQLTAGRLNEFPAWLGNDRIAFGSDGGGTPGIFWLRPDGIGGPDGPVRVTTASEGFASPQSFSLGVLAIATRSNREVWLSTLTLDSLGKARREPGIFEREPEKTFFHASVSPDGKWIAFVSDTSGSRRVYVQAYPKHGSAHQISDEHCQSPVWSPTVSPTAHPTFNVGKPVALGVSGIIQEATYRQYDVMPDGRRFLVLLPSDRSARPFGVQQINVVENWVEELKRRASSSS